MRQCGAAGPLLPVAGSPGPRRHPGYAAVCPGLQVTARHTGGESHSCCAGEPSHLLTSCSSPTSRPPPAHQAGSLGTLRLARPARRCSPQMSASKACKLLPLSDVCRFHHLPCQRCVAGLLCWRACRQSGAPEDCLGLILQVSHSLWWCGAGTVVGRFKGAACPVHLQQTCQLLVPARNLSSGSPMAPGGLQAESPFSDASSFHLSMFSEDAQPYVLPDPLI